MSGTGNFNYYTEFAKNNILIIPAYGLAYLRNIILLPLLIKNLGADAYGSYVLVALALGCIASLSTLATGFTFRRFVSSAKTREEKRNLFYPQFIVQSAVILVFTALCAVNKNRLEGFFIKQQAYFSVYLVPLGLAVYIFFYLVTDYFKSSLRARLYSFAVALESLLDILFVCAVFFIFRQRSLGAVLMAFFLAALSVSGALFVRLCREIGFLPFIPSIRGIARDISLSVPLAVSYISDFVSSMGDRYIIGFMLSTAAVGYYNPAYTLGSLLVFIPKICSERVIQPLLSKAANNEEHEKVGVIIYYAVKIFLMAAIPFIAGSFIFSRPLLGFFMDAGAAGRSYLVIPFVAMGALFYGLSLIYSQVLFLKLQTRPILLINASAAALNIILNIIFLNIFRDIIAAAVVTVITYFIAFLLFCKMTAPYLRVRYDAAVAAKCICATVVMLIPACYSYPALAASPAALIITMAACAVLYVSAIFMLNAVDREERKFIRNILMNMRSA